METSTVLEKQVAISHKSISVKKYGLLFNLLSSILVILLGVAVYKITGLYDGISSVALKIGLGAAISFTYLVVFKRGLCTR